MTALPPAAQEANPAWPIPARAYDYLLGGRHNLECDRRAVDRLLELVPEAKDCAWANRGFHQRAVRWMAERGIRQFLDISDGQPTVGYTHEVAQAVSPECRVVYVEPALQESQRLVTDASRVRVVQGGVCAPECLLAHPEARELLDLSQPAGLLLTAALAVVPDEDDPWSLVTRLTSALAPGSYLALSHLTSDQIPPRSLNAYHEAFEHGAQQLHFRSRADIERFFAGLELVPPTPGDAGRLVYAGEWGAEDPVMADSDGSRWIYCGVAKRS